MRLNRHQRVLLSASGAGVQRILQIGVTIVTIPLILHLLGAKGFGLWAAATSLSWIGGMFDLGLGAALITLLAEAIAKRDFALAQNQISAGCIGTTIIGVIVLVIGVADVYATLTGDGRAAFIIAVAGVAAGVPLSLPNSVWSALQKGYVTAGWNTAQTLLNLAGLLWGVALHAGVPFMVLAFYASTLLANTLSLAHLLFLHHELRPKRMVLPFWLWRQVLSKGVLFALISVSGSLSYSLDNVFTLALLGPLASARMAIAMRIAINAQGIISALVQPLWPAFADAHSATDYAWCRRALVWGSAGVVLLNIVGSSLLIIFGQAIFGWWLHDTLGINHSLLCAIAFWIFGVSVPSVAGLLMNATSVLKFQLVVGATTSLAALVLKFMLASKLGVSGVLVAAPLALMLITWPVYIWKVQKWWRRTIANEPLRRSYL